MTSKENQNVWTIHGKKYDFSAFVDTHPGGKDNILLGRGRDCTELFESVHVLSQDKPKALLRKYEIVTNPTDEKTSEDEQAPKELFTWERQGFYQTVASRVKKYFDENKLSYKGSWKYHLKIYAMLATSVYLLCTALYKGSYLFAFLAGIALEQLHFCSMHDGSHSAVSKSPFLNKLYAGITYWFFWDPWIWLRHHVYAHHCYTGIYRKDPDLTNSKVFVRKHHDVSWKPFYKLQHFHSWFWMMVLPNQHWGQTLVYALSSLKRKVFGVPLEKKPSDLIKPVILTFSFFFHFVFPLLVLSFSQMLAINFILWTIIGISYFTVVLPNHDTDLVNNTIATPSTENPIDWGELQVRNTSNHSINYNSITDRLTTVLYGGMNYQIEHHLFPAVCHEHYHMIAPIVQQTCKEFNIPYNAKGSWLDALVGHFHMLKVLGAKTKKY